MSQACDLTAPSPAGRERDQDDGTIAEVSGFGTAAGGQESVEDIAVTGFRLLG
jgi:hypothetical protein